MFQILSLKGQNINIRILPYKDIYVCMYKYVLKFKTKLLH